MNNKKGITLLYLVIVIIVMIILAGTIVVQMNTSSDGTKLAGFANDITQMQDYIRSNYILEGTFPYKDGTNAMTTDELLKRVAIDNKSAFSNELTTNYEPNDTRFYILDLDKMDIDKQNRGLEQRGPDDIYVVSTSTLKVYYLYGINYKDQKYFSLNTKVAKVLNITIPVDDTSNLTVNQINGVEVTKNNALWTNNMDVVIKAEMGTGETLSIGFKGGTSKNFATQNGHNEYKFSNLTDLNGRGVLSSLFTTAQIKAFSELSNGDKKLTLTKSNESGILQLYDIDLSNYDDIKPEITNIVKNTYNDILVITGNVNDIHSGVNQIKYDYNKAVIDEIYLREKAKVAQNDNGTFAIKVPVTAKNIKIAVIDNAGNMSYVDVTN